MWRFVWRSRRFAMAGLGVLLLLLELTLGVLNYNPAATAGAWRRAVVGAPHTSLAISQQAPRRHETTPLARIINHPIQSSGCGKPSPIAAGDSADRSMSSGGIQRLYRLHIPQRYQPRHAYPLVLSFHGNGSTALQQERRTGFSALADHIGFVVIYPQGTPGPNGRLGWSSGGPGHPVRDDVLFVSDLLTAAQSLLCIDPLRIYATGFSNGGGMTALLACRLAGRIAAYAPVSGSYYPVAGGCAPGRPVALLEVHGSDDRTVPYTGNPKTHLLAVSVWLAQWARRDACASSPQTQSLSPSVTRLTWTGCRGHVAVEHLRVQGGQHVWPPALLPASGDPSALPSAPQTAQMIWAFLSHYTLPTALA